MKAILSLFDSRRLLPTLPFGTRALLKTLLTLLASVGLVFAQGGPPADSTPKAGLRAPVSPDSSEALNWDSVYAGIQEDFVKLRPIFQRGCSDCHSDQTRYPWYHNLPGIKGMIDKDIRVARKRLKMSEGFPFGNHVRPADDLSRIRGELEEHDMPPWEYRLMHWSANPSVAERDSVISWIDESLKLLAAHGQYPFGLPSEAPETNQGKNESDSSN
jgi:hypothetical protein